MGNLTVQIGTKTYTKSLINGSAMITVNDLSSGSYNAIVSYSSDENYAQSYEIITFTVPTPKLSANNIKAIYSQNTIYKVLLTVNSTPVVGKYISINYNGKTAKVKTNSKGYATLKLNTKVNIKKYIITSTFRSVKITNKLTVKHLIVAKNIIAKKSKKVLNIKVFTKKVKGKYLKGKKLTLKLRGKTLKAKINNKGIAIFKVKKKYC